jgi:hypothetical protein
MFKWFKPKQSIIEFRCHEENWDVIPKPYPARKFMPNWYKDLVPKLDSHADSSTVKRCAPFLDAMIVGWIIPLASEVHITTNEDCSRIDWHCGWDKPILESHKASQINNDKHPKYPKPPIKFLNYWSIKVPDGWSVLFTPPFNREDERFSCITGIVDCDRYEEFINFPAFWNKPNFEGILSVGTPLVQAIPIQRSSFEIESNIHELNDQELKKIQKTSAKLKIERSHYRNNLWVRK